MKRILLLSVVLLAGCRVGLVQGSDRPDDVALLGPPPPPDFGCDRGIRREVDTDNDKKPDLVVWEADGREICRGQDTDRDLRVDQWQKVQNGKVVEMAEDTDKNGTLDVRRKDTDGDGTLDQVTPIQLTIPQGPPGAK